MEYRLNKIDTELRQIVNDSIKEGKVHGNKELARVNKDREDKKGQQSNKSFKKELAKYKVKKKISVDAIKVKNIDVEASKEGINLTQGRFLDTKR